MRTSPSTSTVTPFRSGPVSFGRRPLASYAGHLTCICLMVHQTSADGAQLFVSDNADVISAIWVDKAMLSIDPKDRGPFIVATMSQAFANQKRLMPRTIDPSKYTADEARDLQDAVMVAARTRLRLRNFREPLAYPGRNAWA